MDNIFTACDDDISYIYIYIYISLSLSTYIYIYVYKQNNTNSTLPKIMTSFFKPVRKWASFTLFRKPYLRGSFQFVYKF